MTTDYGIAVFEQHAAILRASAISSAVAHERGYRSADTKAQLERYGFGQRQRLVPALVLPIWTVTGEQIGAQIRPDEPRYDGEKPLKYETPRKFRMRVDVPPRVREHLDDPSRLLVITEGIRKADSLVSRGIDAVALLGVWNFRGTNDKGGTTVLPDLQQIAWKGPDISRRVLVVFDSDAMLKPQVHQAMTTLGGLLASWGADVAYVYLPSADSNGTKQGVDDFLADDEARGIDALLELSTETPKQPVSTMSTTPPKVIAEWDGEVPLAAIRDALARYVVLPEHGAVAVALWVVHTYLTECFYTTPRLSVQSPEKESGKSRLLEVLALLAREARLWTHISTATLYRRIGIGPVTALIDEVDNIFTSRNDPEKADLRAVLNEGYRKGASVPRCVGANRDEIAEFPVYAPIALAGIGTLPDTLTSRSLIIAMKRRTATERVESFRERQARAELAPLREQIEAWAATLAETLDGYVPVMPEGVTDRAADIWEPLLAIAELAGPAEAELARAACLAMSRATDEASRSLGVRLLADCKAIFAAAGREAMWTDELLAELHGLEDAPWTNLHGEPLDSRTLAKLLKPYGVKSSQVFIDSVNKRGYRATGDGGLHEAWQRYCPDEAAPLAYVLPETDAMPASDASNPPAIGSPVSSPSGPSAGPGADIRQRMRAYLTECGPADMPTLRDALDVELADLHPAVADLDDEACPFVVIPRDDAPPLIGIRS